MPSIRIMVVLKRDSRENGEKLEILRNNARKFPKQIKKTHQVPSPMNKKERNSQGTYIVVKFQISGNKGKIYNQNGFRFLNSSM